MDSKIKNSVLQWLDDNEKRKQMLKMFGFLSSDEEQQSNEKLTPNPKSTSPEPAQPSPEKKSDDEESMKYSSKSDELTYAIGAEVRTVNVRHMSVLKDGEYTSRCTGRTRIISMDTIDSLVYDPKYTEFCIERICDLIR